MENYSKMKKIFIELLIIILVVISILFFIKPVFVRGESMLPTLKDGDYLIASRQSYTIFGDVNKGDIVIFPHRGIDGDKKLLVKRIIATAGDRIQIENGKVSVNDEELVENYIGYTTTFGQVDLEVPEGEVFVMGDNRENSLDSRNFGTVKVKELSGKIKFRLYPLGKFGGID